MDELDLMEKGRLKRIFRARNKIIFPGAIVHITQRAPGKEPLFLEDADYLFMLYLIKETAKAFFWEVFSFVLMPNHLHLLFRLGKANLSQAAKSLFERYANYFNQKYERKGHVFGGAYREAVCLDDTYFLASSLYIHLNPVSVGLVNNPLDCRWSSCRLFWEPVKKSSFVNYEFILKILDEDIDKARKAYRDLLEQGKERKLVSLFEDHKALEKFRTEIFTGMTNFLRLKSEELVNEEGLNKGIEELKVKKRLRTPQDFAARKFLIEQLMARGYNITEIATKLDINRATIYRFLNFTEKR